METEVTSMLDALADIAWTALPDGTVDFLNQRWYEYTGLSDDGSNSHSWEAAIHPADRTELLSRWGAGSTSGQWRDIEARIRQFDGEYRHFLLRARPTTDTSGQIVKWYGMTIDIEEQRHTAGEVIRLGEDHFRAIADNIPAHIGGVDAIR